MWHPHEYRDLHLNGKYEPEPGETNPFAGDDDFRTIKGYKKVFEDSPDPKTRVHTESEQREEYNLKVTPEGKIKGTVTYVHSTTRTENLGRTGTFRTEWDIKIEK